SYSLVVARLTFLSRRSTCTCAHPALHSFPTRRSSDLTIRWVRIRRLSLLSRAHSNFNLHSKELIFGCNYTALNVRYTLAALFYSPLEAPALLWFLWRN